jgi:hypothetical protein
MARYYRSTVGRVNGSSCPLVGERAGVENRSRQFDTRANPTLSRPLTASSAETRQELYIRLYGLFGNGSA